MQRMASLARIGFTILLIFFAGCKDDGTDPPKIAEREKQEQDEHERHLLTNGHTGDDAAFKELARLQYRHAGGRFTQFLMNPDYAIPDSINQQGLRQLGLAK
jgi:hypothetical protein